MSDRTPWLPAAAVAVLLLLGPAGALAAGVTMVNRDTKDHKLTIVEDAGAKTTEHVLKPSQVLEGVCAAGCVVRINDSTEDEYELEAGDKVSIEDGFLYYDEPEAGAPGAAAAPAAPATTPAPAAPAPAVPAPAQPATPAPEKKN